MLDIVKAEAEIAKMMAETAKLNREGRWYPVQLAAIIIGSAAALGTAIVTAIKALA